LPPNTALDIFSGEPYQQTLNSPDLFLLNSCCTGDPTLGLSGPSADAAWNPYLPQTVVNSALPTEIDAVNIPADASNTPPQSWYPWSELSPTAAQSLGLQTQRIAIGPSTEFESVPSNHFSSNISEIATSYAESFSYISDPFVNANCELSTVLAVHQPIPISVERPLSFDQHAIAMDFFDTSLPASPGSAQSFPVFSDQHLQQPNSIACPSGPTNNSRQALSRSVKHAKMPLPQLAGSVACPHCPTYFGVKGQQFK
jgi:hypothetical protein